jgi:hypothetical protein
MLFNIMTDASSVSPQDQGAGAAAVEPSFARAPRQPLASEAFLTRSVDSEPAPADESGAKVLETALYHETGPLPEPTCVAHRFC